MRLLNTTFGVGDDMTVGDTVSAAVRRRVGASPKPVRTLDDDTAEDGEGMVGNEGRNVGGNAGPENQLVGLCVMLAMVQEYVPDADLFRLVWALGGPRVFSETLIQVQLAIENDGETHLLEATRDAIARVRAHVAEHDPAPPYRRAGRVRPARGVD